MAVGQLIVKGNLQEAALAILSAADQKQYAGQYVCVVSFQDHRVIAAHSDAAQARRLAREKGYPEAVCFYNQRPEEVMMPSCGAWPDAVGAGEGTAKK